MQYFFIIVLSLIIGSFLNVVIYRIPEGESIIYPGSHCPECGNRLKVCDLVPVFSYLSTGGKCRYCGEPISLQYPLVEIITATVFVLIYVKTGLTVELAVMLLLASFLIVVTFIDLNQMLIPNKLTYPFLILGPVLAVFLPHLSLLQSLLGGLIPGALFLLLVFIYPEGLGMGDVKLVAATGTFLGWRVVLGGIFLGSFIGLIIFLILMAMGKVDRKTRIPYAPLINSGVFLVAMFSEQLLVLYNLIFNSSL